MYGPYRTFNGRRYTFVGSFKYKKYAKQTASRIKKNGERARIIHDKDQTKPYAVYRG